MRAIYHARISAFFRTGVTFNFSFALGAAMSNIVAKEL